MIRPDTVAAEVTGQTVSSAEIKGSDHVAKQAINNGANLGFEAQLWAAADKLRGTMERSDYKHVALGLIFLKYISHAFEAKRAALLAEELADPEDSEAYLAENVFWVPKEARWSYLQARARQPTIGKDIDNAILAIEARNASLKGVLPNEYARPALNKIMLGELIDLVSRIGMAEESDRSRDIHVRGYEYFLGGFAGAEGKRAGEFYTPRSVVQLLVEMLEPYKGRVHDPCCGSGGMFVQSERFVEEHGGRIGDIAIYGQESNDTTWRLARMNLAVRGIDADIRWNNEGSFHKDELPHLKADFILADPPFNVSDRGGDRLREDARWAFGVPPAGNANYAWLHYIHHHLVPNGTAGVVLANGSMSAATSGEGAIRRTLVEANVVDCMIALPGQLFYSTQTPACLWFLTRNKNPGGNCRDRRREVLFIDARKVGHMVDRTRKEFSDEDITRIADTYHAWRGAPDANPYEDEPGFSKSATLEEIGEHGHVLTPGRYVGATVTEDDDVPFEERFRELQDTLNEQFAEADDPSTLIREKLGGSVRMDYSSNDRLGDVIESKRGYDLPTAQRQPGSVPIISSSGPSGVHDKAKVTGPGVVTGRYGTIRQVFYVESDFWPLNTSLYVRDFKGHDPRFIYYFLQGIDWERFNDKSGVPGINRNHAHNAFVTIPPADGHQVIAELLGALDDKIDLNRQMNETPEAMARAIFKDWFVDFGPTRAKAEGCASYLAPELWDLFPDALGGEGKPIGWANRWLGDFLELAYGKSLPKKKRMSGNVAVYGSGGLTGTHDTVLINRPAVIVGRNGTVGSLYWKDGPVFPIDTTFFVVPRIGSVLFGYHLLAAQPLQEMNTDAAVPGLNRGNAYRLEFPEPASELISAFEEIAGALWQCRARNPVEVETLAETRDLLLPNLMSGEIRLRDTEAVVKEVA